MPYHILVASLTLMALFLKNVLRTGASLRSTVTGPNFQKLMFNSTVMLPKSESGVMFCFQSYQGLRIDRGLVY